MEVYSEHSESDIKNSKIDPNIVHQFFKRGKKKTSRGLNYHKKFIAGFGIFGLICFIVGIKSMILYYKNSLTIQAKVEEEPIKNPPERYDNPSRLYKTGNFYFKTDKLNVNIGKGTILLSIGIMSIIVSTVWYKVLSEQVIRLEEESLRRTWIDVIKPSPEDLKKFYNITAKRKKSKGEINTSVHVV